MSRKWKHRVGSVGWFILGGVCGPLAGEWWADWEHRKGYR